MQVLETKIEEVRSEATPDSVKEDLEEVLGAASQASTAPVKKAKPVVRKELDPKRKAEVLEEAYAKCTEITEKFSKTFSAGSKLMTPEQQKATAAVYVWCRRTDDLVDSPRAGMRIAAALEQDLQQWRERLYRIFDEGVATDILDYALIDTKENYPLLDIEPFEDMIEGMVMDTPQLGQARYETFDDLYIYCYRVASTVGLMMLPVLGFASGCTEEDARAPAIALGIALQLTNICRDVGEDFQTRGRIYLPMEDLRRFGVTERQLQERRIDENYINFMKFQIQRARDYYKMAEDGIPALAPEGRLSVQAAAKMYGGILEKIEANDYDNLSKRAYVSTSGKLKRLAQSMIDVQIMAQKKGSTEEGCATPDLIEGSGYRQDSASMVDVSGGSRLRSYDRRAQSEETRKQETILMNERNNLYE